MGIKAKITRATEYTTRGIAIADAFSAFCKEKEAIGCSKDTLRNYRQSFKMFMEFNSFDETEPLYSIDKDTLNSWIAELNAEGVRYTSINHYLRDVRAFFNWCMDEERKYLPYFKVTMVRGHEELPKFFPDEDVEKLLVKPVPAASFTEWRTWAVVNWVMATGNRAASICSVKMKDIDLKEKEIFLAHTKSKKAQTLPMSTALYNALKEYIKIWRSDADEDEYLFSNVGADKLSTNALRHSFAKYCNERGVDQTNIHGLRHSFARLYILNGGEAFKLQRILGHSTLTMTQHYINLFDADLKKDYDAFSPLDTLKHSSSRTVRVTRSA